MSYDKVEQAKKTIIGTKQTVKAIHAGIISEMVAEDADQRVTAPAVEEAGNHCIQVTYVHSSEKLGQICGIQVAAAVVAITG